MSTEYDFIVKRIESTKADIANSKKAEGVCSQHDKFVELHMLHLDVGLLNLETSQHIKGSIDKLAMLHPQQEKTVREISTPFFKLKGYGAWAAVFIIGLIIFSSVVIGAIAMAE